MSNKIQKAFRSYSCCCLFFITAPFYQTTAQDTGYIRPPVTSKYEEYKKQVKQEVSKTMVELRDAVPGIVYDLRYASTNNFMHRLMYPAGTRQTFLRKPAAEALNNVQEELAKKGMGLKIFDAYRPYSVTVKFWDLIRDERFVAHPRNGSGHNRGIAVDLTIIMLKTGQELNMGTGFDNFSDTAHQGFSKLPEAVLQNRQLLRNLMEQNGFKPYADEWWHYSWPSAVKFEILDIEFKKLAKDL
ncbi:MAG: M15 family metallopeptidase [Chitinophagaceae bacterium]|nr:M15 family metallopeptidase [Chitinophagaceae bacterium]MBP6589844.1 M15 family metallopeptidase [Chitinophagaceae bacterium]